jgi:hypothetical protein
MGTLKGQYIQETKTHPWFLYRTALGMLIFMDSFLKQDSTEWYLSNMESRLFPQAWFLIGRFFKATN